MDEKIEKIMEHICDLCHHLYEEKPEDDLDDQCHACDECTIEAEIRALMVAEGQDRPAPVRARKTGYRPSKVAMREDGRR